MAGFHHDLYRGCGRGRFWVMEQQPGPVNWARFNPAPIPGMVRAWTWEAFAHGAELVSYFRWRQAPFGQEQLHAGLHRPDRVEDQGGREARQVAGELTRIGPLRACARAPAALVFSYEADWHLNIQPQGEGFRWLQLAFETYGALRRRGLDVDILPPGADFSGYRLVVCPSLPLLDAATLAALEASGAVVLFGPRTGSRTQDGHIPPDLPPGPLQRLLAMKVIRVESLRPGAGPMVRVAESPLPGRTLPGRLWREAIDTALPSRADFTDGGGPAWIVDGRFHYLATWPEAVLFDAVIAAAAAQAGVALIDLPEGVRLRSRDGVTFAVNFATEPRFTPAPEDAVYLLGGPDLPPGGVSAWR
jgi:beta-galactosidase